MRNSTLFWFYTPIFLLCFISSSYAQQAQVMKEGAKLILLSDGFSFTEGPAADHDGNVYFTDQPNDRILKWDISKDSILEYMKPSGRANGLYFDREGNLLAAADENNELWQISPDKKVSVIAGFFKGKILNGPNDLWVDTKGGIYFTDPYYQREWWKHTEPEQKEQRVYYLPKDKKRVSTQIAVDGLNQPNGIIGTPDGKTLYIADIGAKMTYSFTINGDGSLSNKMLFTKMGSDGMTIDDQGNVYLTGDGVTIFDKTGKQIAHINVPESWTANVTFGGADNDILFITAMDSVYTLKMSVHGVRQ